MRSNSKFQLYKKYQKDSRRRGVEFKLSFRSFKRLIAADCHYCGAAPAGVWKNGKKTRSYHLLYNGVDRKDNQKGYVPRNCVPACKRCNFAKARLTKEEFLDMVKEVYRNHVL